MRRPASSTAAMRSNQYGFSLLELMVAMAIFMLISAAAITLFWHQQINSQTMTGQVGLNLSLRNAVTQMEMDVANAGSAYLQSANMPSWPVGIAIVNNVVPQGNSCKTGTYTYGASCFDQLNIIDGADPSQFPPVVVTDSSGGVSPTTNCSYTDQAVAYSKAASVGGTAWTLNATAAEFNRGDQILFMNSTGTKISTAVLTHDADVSGSVVRFRFNATNANGTNSGGPNGSADPLDITTCEGTSPCSLVNPPPNVQPRVTNQFCAGDWIMKLNPIIYSVDITSDPYNPRLMRKVGNTTSRIVMEQILGFKVGATIWNDAGSNPGTTFADSGSYVYDASTYCNVTCPGDMAFNFTIVRSVRVSLIGRTTPDWRGTYTYRNGFDSGPYQVQGIAVVVNPRNMSMND